MYGLPSFLSADVTVLVALFLLVTVINVGKVRQRHKIAPPATTGNPELERAIRVQANSVEQVVIFLPLLWVATLFPAAMILAYLAPALGVVWLVGRVLYLRGYMEAANKRSRGFTISLAATMGLMGLSILGLLVHGFRMIQS